MYLYLYGCSVSYKLLTKLIKNKAELFTTNEILTEFGEVLSRDFKYISEEIQEKIDFLETFIKVIEPTSKINVIINDPDDNKILECAVDSSLDYIITYDKHLLILKEYQGIKIIKPEDLYFIDYR